MEIEFWTEQRAVIRDLLDHGDRERFLQWTIVADAMFFEPPPDELNYLKRLPDWPSMRELLKDPGVGGAVIDPVLKTNGNIIHHLYSMFRFEEATAHRLADDSRIVEFGGGYGNFCRLMFRRGFSGRYVIYDLPEVLELQKWYLGRTLAADEYARVEFVTALPDGADTVIGLWSISEMPVELRDRIKTLKPNYFLIGYQHNIAGIMNVDYFDRWIEDNAYDWTNVPIPHISGNFYLFGVRR